MRARKRFGQHFLHDHAVIDRIVAAIAPRPDQHLVEIGAGRGALTVALVETCRQLDLVELDRDLVALLHKRFSAHEHVSIHSADALRFDFSNLAEPGEKLRLIGNLPYNISTPLLFRLATHQRVIADMHFMLQKEVVARACAQPGSKAYGKLSVMLQYHYRVEPLFDVPPAHFKPEPKVLSAVVRLSPHAALPVTVKSLPMLQQIVTQAFSQRRKTLRNALKPLFSDHEIEALDIDPAARPDTLGIDAFARLSDYRSNSAKTRTENITSQSTSSQGRKR